MIWWYWILFGLGLLVLELFLPSGFFIFFFGIGALLTGTIVGVGVEVADGMQWGFCTLISIVLALVFRKYLMGQWDSPSSFNNSPEGREVLIAEEVLPNSNGSCEFRGTRWSVRNVGAEPLLKGDRAVVDGREGFTLLVKKMAP